MLDHLYYSPSKSFLSYCVAFLLGVAIASAVEISKVDTMYTFIGIMVPMFFLLLFWREKQTRFVSFIGLFFLIGIFRYGYAVPNDIAVISKKESFTATIVAEPDVRIDSVKYIVTIEDGVYEGEKLYFSSLLYPRYTFGDTVNIHCEIKRPEAFEDFRYDMYLATRGVFLTCTNPNITFVQQQQRKSFFSALYGIKSHVANQINTLWPEPHASFMAGLLYGYRGGLGSLQEQFNITGVTHIVAISGYNITIISTILLSVLIALCVRRQHAFWFVVIGIVLFVLFVGASASVVRAGVMGILVLLARQMGRMSQISNVLVLTAIVMVAWNPYILLWDVGFQLSFLATIGLVYIAPFIERSFSVVPTSFGLRESIVATLAATVATLPLILFQFERLSVVSPIVNVLILPIIPFIMTVGFMATVVSFFFFPLGQLIGFIAWGGMTYIITIVRLFATMSFAALDIAISLPIVVCAYGILAYIVKKYQKKKQVGTTVT